MRKINPKTVKAIAFHLISFYNEEKEYKIYIQQKKVSTFIFAGFIDGVLKTGLFLLGIKPFNITLPFLAVYGCVSLIACARLFSFRRKLNE